MSYILIPSYILWMHTYSQSAIAINVLKLVVCAASIPSFNQDESHTQTLHWSLLPIYHKHEPLVPEPDIASDSEYSLKILLFNGRFRRTSSILLSYDIYNRWRTQESRRTDIIDSWWGRVSSDHIRFRATEGGELADSHRRNFCSLWHVPITASMGADPVG